MVKYNSQFHEIIAGWCGGEFVIELNVRDISTD